MQVNPKHAGQIENFVLWIQPERLEWNGADAEILVTLGIADAIAEDGTVIGQGFCVEHIPASYQSGSVRFHWPQIMNPYHAEIDWALQYLVETMCKNYLLVVYESRCHAFIGLAEQTLLD